MEKRRRIYLLQGLPPEVVAVAFAKTSRSPKAFDEITKELTEESSAEFHEKWVVGYGHASVAEHAVLSIAIENVSRYATEVIEANRLASYTEKSSRFQVFSLDDFYVPDEVAASPLGEDYRESMRWIFENYHALQARLEAFIKEKGVLKRRENEAERGYGVRARAYALDRSRFLLPIAALANVGMTVNARNLEHGITKMLSHELSEVRQIGANLKEVSRAALPTLIKYADVNPYLRDTGSALKELATSVLADGGTREASSTSSTARELAASVLADGSSVPKASEENYTRLIQFPENPEAALAAAILFKYSHLPYEAIRERVTQMPRGDQEKVIEEALRRRERFDIPVREMEYLTYTFECLVDQGAFLDLKRHRMCSQSPQAPTIRHGFTIPELIEEAGLKGEYLAGVEKAEKCFERFLPDFPNEAPYFVLNAHHRRFLWQMNLREVMHVVKLRSDPKGHFTYRRAAQQIYREVQRVHPQIARYIEVNLEPATGR